RRHRFAGREGEHADGQDRGFFDGVVPPVQPGRVGLVDGVVGGVAVAVELLGVAGIEYGIDGDESAGFGVVFAGAFVDEAGRVVGTVEEAVFAEPVRRRGAAG